MLRGSTLRRRLALTLEGEAGFNDPVAILLVLGFIEWIQQPDYGIPDMALLLARELGIGLVVGLAVGWLGLQGLRRARLATAGAYPLGTMGIAAIAYGAADTLHGSGFLAVYLAGLILGSSDLPRPEAVRIFHQGLGWVAQVTMFLVLGLLVFPSQLGEVAVEGTLLARRSRLRRPPGGGDGRDRVQRLLARRAGGARLGRAARSRSRSCSPPFRCIEGVPRSLEFFNIVFFAVLLSTLVQGSTFEPLARRLGITTDDLALDPEQSVRRAGSTAVVSIYAGLGPRGR